MKLASNSASAINAANFGDGTPGDRQHYQYSNHSRGGDDMGQRSTGADSFSQVTPALIAARRTSLVTLPVLGSLFQKPTAPGRPSIVTTTKIRCWRTPISNFLSIWPSRPGTSTATRLGRRRRSGNAADFLATFPRIFGGAGGQFFMFLDVEGLPQQGNPSLSLSYYTGWAQTACGFSQKPKQQRGYLATVYLRANRRQCHRKRLVAANNNGIKCHGAWVARITHRRLARRGTLNRISALPNVQLPFAV